MNLTSVLRPSASTAARLIGLILVIVSMFLPAVIVDPDSIPGYFCAFITLIVPFNDGIRHIMGHSTAKQLISVIAGDALFSCGLINPLLLVYLFCRPTWRKPISLAIVILFIDAVYLLAKLRLPPRSGFFFWLAGIVLILVSAYKPKTAVPDPIFEA